MKAVQSSVFNFGSKFLKDHAGRMIKDPKIALVELVANSWDAGATEVYITWPKNEGGKFIVTDNGEGMTHDDFMKIWYTISYNRIDEQGKEVIFTVDGIKRTRLAYGKNGKGRNSVFCFDDKYEVKTWKEGIYSVFNVLRRREIPYEVKCVDSGKKNGSGTEIKCIIDRKYLTIDAVKTLIGSKFFTDPDFKVYVNDSLIEMVDLEDNISRTECYVCPDEPSVEIILIDSKKVGRTSHQHGIAWWVQNRLVIHKTWEQYMDRRTNPAKRYSIIIKANLLEDYVNPDWTGFKDSPKVKEVTKKVDECIHELIQDLLKESRHDIKMELIKDHSKEIRQLSTISRDEVGQFIDNVQENCIGISYAHLSKVTELLTNMYLSQRGYELVFQLSKLSSEELDDLGNILEKWSITDAKKVLDELYWRLAIIKKMSNLVENPKADELHDLQPLFEAGLWIFGPEYEGIGRYTSNQSLSTVIKKFFNKKKVKLKNPKKRPDFVLLEDSSIGAYASDDYDESSEVDAINKVLIIELKKGGFKVSNTEKRQAIDYALDLVDSGAFSSNDPKIVCYVLGAKVDPSAKRSSKEGDNIIVETKTYESVLRRADARTHRLIRKIEDTKGISTELNDREIKEVLRQKIL